MLRITLFQRFIQCRCPFKYPLCECRQKARHRIGFDQKKIELRCSNFGTLLNRKYGEKMHKTVQITIVSELQRFKALIFFHCMFVWWSLYDVTRQSSYCIRLRLTLLPTTIECQQRVPITRTDICVKIMQN